MEIQRRSFDPDELGARETTLLVKVCSIARRVSLRPLEVNSTIGGSSEAIVKNECGARLSVPSASRVPTQAIGRHPGHGESTTLGQERPSLDEWRERGW
jgi:hypothetical protein